MTAPGRLTSCTAPPDDAGRGAGPNSPPPPHLSSAWSAGPSCSTPSRVATELPHQLTPRRSSQPTTAADTHQLKPARPPRTRHSSPPPATPHASARSPTIQSETHHNHAPDHGPLPDKPAPTRLTAGSQESAVKRSASDGESDSAPPVSEVGFGVGARADRRRAMPWRDSPRASRCCRRRGWLMTIPRLWPESDSGGVAELGVDLAGQALGGSTMGRSALRAATGDAAASEQMAPVAERLRSRTTTRSARNQLRGLLRHTASRRGWACAPVAGSASSSRTHDAQQLERLLAARAGDRQNEKGRSEACCARRSCGPPGAGGRRAPARQPDRHDAPVAGEAGPIRRGTARRRRRRDRRRSQAPTRSRRGPSSPGGSAKPLAARTGPGAAAAGC